MAGHSKWANIKHRKAAQDKKRGKLYTKLIREITVAARLGGGVVDDNPRLRAAVDKALGANMPKDTIERAVARGAGGGEGNDVEELAYEGYANGGVAILVEAMTAIVPSPRCVTRLISTAAIWAPMDPLPICSPAKG